MAMALATTVGAGMAEAQSDGPRVLLSVNAGLQPGSEQLGDAGTFPLYDETGLLTVDGEASTGALFDFAAHIRVARRVTVGFGMQHGGSEHGWNVNGTAPSPVFFNQPRPFSTVAEGLKRSENAFHFSVGYLLPVNDRFDLLVYGGPTLFQLEQDVVSAVTVNETPSFGVTPTVERREEDSWGAHLGFDATYALMQNSGGSSFGLGAFVRWAGGSTDLPIISNTVETDLGGFQIGAGVRFRF
jgi:hypothetical protein